MRTAPLRSTPILLSMLTFASLVTFGTVERGSAAAETCANPQTQLEMTTCAGDAAAASARLVATGLAKLERATPDQKTLIEKSERAFEAYRTAACAVAAAQVAGGSMEPMQRSACEDALNKQRAQTLTNQLPQGR